MSSTSATISGLDPKSSYTVRVKAIATDADHLNSDYSSIVFDTTVGKLLKPVVTVSPGTSTATVSWNSIANASKYYVQYKESSASDWKPYGYTTSTSVRLASLSASKTYTVRVKAYSGDTAKYANSDYTTVSFTQTKLLNTSGVSEDLSMDLAFAELEQDDFWNDELFDDLL